MTCTLSREPIDDATQIEYKASRPEFDFLAGGGQMGELIRAKDWSKTPLGPIEAWSQSLRSALSICLQSRFPTAIYWGPELVVLYNDAWSPIPGKKHPRALGLPGRELWPEIWHLIGPMFQGVITTGKGVLAHDELLPMLRRGFVEECYFDYNCSPIRDENGKNAGIFNVANEVTARLIGERRTKLLYGLNQHMLGVASNEDACSAAIAMLGKASADVPFALLYVLNKKGDTVRLAGSVGLKTDGLASPESILLTDKKAPWSLQGVVRTGKMAHLDTLSKSFGALPGGAWEEPSKEALLLPITLREQMHPYGVLVAGISPRLQCDDVYKMFYQQVTETIAGAIERANGLAERRQLEQREREGREQLTTALSTGSVGTWMWDVGSDKVVADKNLAAMFGIATEKAAIGLPINVLINAIHPEDRRRAEKRIAVAVERIGAFEAEYRTVSADGDIRWVVARGRVQKNEKNGQVRFPGVLVDITRQKQLELNLDFLARSSKIIASSLDYNVTLKKVADLLVPAIADWCVIDMCEDSLHLESVALAHKDPAKIKWAKQLSKRFPPDNDGQSGSSKVMKTGKPEYYPVINDAMLKASAKNEEHLLLLRSVGLSSAMILPLRADGETVGTLTLISAEQKRHFTKADLAMAEELTSRISLAITNARLYTAVQDELAQRKRLEQELRVANEGLEMRVRERTARLEATNNGLKAEIAKRKEAEDTLSRERELLQTVLGTIDAGIVACDAEGVLTYFNRATRDLHGLPQEPILAAEWAEYYNLYQPDGKTPMQQQDVPLFRALDGEHVANVEMVVAPNEGSPRTLLASGQIMTDGKGMKTGAVVAMQDVTELKQAEKSLREYTQELARSNQELQDFAYVASHDLQEPLRKIRAFGDLLEEEYGQQLGDGADYLGRMRGAASRMSTLIEDLLEFSRVTTQAKPFASVDLNAVAVDVVNDLEIALRATKGKVRVGKLPTIAADATQMRQLLQNLIGNAIKFHKEGTAPAISVRATRLSTKDDEPEMWRITVTDNGIGFEEKYTERIFSVFQRLHGRESYEGTGIGLAVCRKIAERHGGIINAHSTLGEGATFIVELPGEQAKE